MMPGWTTGEIRKLKDVHRTGRPRLSELEMMLPRHSRAAIALMAHKQGLRKPVGKPRNRKIRNRTVYWLCVAHRHFVSREAEMRVAA